MVVLSGTLFEMVVSVEVLLPRVAQYGRRGKRLLARGGLVGYSSLLFSSVWWRLRLPRTEGTGTKSVFPFAFEVGGAEL